MEMGKQFALFGPPRSIPRRGPNWAPEIGPTPRDTSTQMWEGHSNPQLPMFLTAREIKHNYQPLFADRWDTGDQRTSHGMESDSQLWERKAEEAYETGLTQHLNEQNWQFDRAVPLTAPDTSSGRVFMRRPPFDDETGTRADTRPEILDGHHRIAAADDDYSDHGSPDALIPVVHIPPHEMYRYVGRSVPTF